MVGKLNNTEVTILPIDWNETTLGQIGTFKKGRNIPKSNIVSEGLPCVLYGEIYTRYNNKSSILISKITEEVAKNATGIKYGDILFAGSGETAEDIGKCFTYTGIERAFAGGDIIIFTPTNDNSIFLSYILNDIGAIRQKSLMGQGSSVFHIYISNLEKIKIPLPSTVEQTAIATALNDTDNLIIALEQLIAKKKAIKQGAMQELLRPKKGWEIKKLGDATDVIGGGTPSTLKMEYWNGNINWFTPTEIGESKYSFQSLRKISKDGLANCSAKLLPPGSILLTSRANIGDVSILKVGACTNQGFQSLIAKNGYCNEFIYYLIIVSKHLLIQNASGSTFLEISPNKVKSIELHFPSFDVQQKIAQTLSDMDTEIEQLEKQLEKHKRIKQGMMQVLLTGKIRLI